MNGGKQKTLRDTTSEKQCHNCHAMAYRSRRRAQLFEKVFCFVDLEFLFRGFLVVVVGWVFGGLFWGLFWVFSSFFKPSIKYVLWLYRK